MIIGPLIIKKIIIIKLAIKTIEKFFSALIN